MSGGYWNYKQCDLCNTDINITNLTLILFAVKNALYSVDWCLSNDISKEDCMNELFEIIKKLGDDLYGDCS